MEPYEIVGELKPFNRRRDAFARSRSDPTSAAFGAKGRSREEIAAAGGPGYSLEDLALRAGARAVDRALQEHWEAQRRGARAPSGARHEPEDREVFTRQVKDAAGFYGACLVGVVRVNPLWLYAAEAGRPPAVAEGGLDTAVVMAIEMDYERIATSPAFPASAATGKGYSEMAFAATCLGRYLTELGYRALPSGNDTALSIPLAIDAGLGELGRNGSLITERYGPRVRLCKVFTDAPLVPDRPVRFGARELCQTCAKCAEACPVGAIPTGPRTARGPTPSNNPGVLKWYVDPDRCLSFWRANGADCSNCIRSCPFNSP